MASSQDYTELIDGLDQCGQTLCSLVEELLRHSKIQFQHVTYRVKSAESALKKLNLKLDRYNGLEDMTDLLGIRVITYFPHDVDKVAEVIRSEFTVDEDSSVDKRKLLDPDKFGYLSLHFVASLTNSRNHLAEYKRFADKKFEIQIRSVLQHAWAEIEHDLGYKMEGALPDEMRRSFSRLAGMLELADEEFERLRQRLTEYEKHVQRTIADSPQKLPINQSTLVAAVKREKALHNLDKMIARLEGTTLEKNVLPSYIGNRAKDLKILGIDNLDQLLKIVDQYQDHIEAFAKQWLSRYNRSHPTNDPFPRGIGLFYLDYVLASQRPEIEKTKWRHYMTNNRAQMAKEMREHWQSVVNKLGEPELKNRGTPRANTTKKH